ncbi:MAG: Hsp20/alpha crystallin family protein [Terriglobia bacterium]
MKDAQSIIVHTRTVTSFHKEVGGPETGKDRPAELESLLRRSPRGFRSEDPFSTIVEQKKRRAYNLFESNSQFIIEADVAGTSPSDLDIQVFPNHIEITSASTPDDASRGHRTHCHELNQGEIESCIQLPRPIDPEKVSAEFHNGILQIRAEIAGEMTKGTRS